MTHIDPFAPGDSPQHPANWTESATPSVEDRRADQFQWMRDHFAMASEAGQDISERELQDRYERYLMLLERVGTDDERDQEAEFVSFPALLRRDAFADLEDDEIEEWKALFELHSTDDERDPLWVEAALPGLDELRARAAGVDVTAAADVTQAGTPVPEILLTAPKGNALKEDWVEYALAVDKARGGTLTKEQAEKESIADLKAAYKPKAS